MVEIAGFFIAFLIALTGVGAGTLTAPLLILLGFDPLLSVGIALSVSSMIKIPTVLLHATLGTVSYKHALLMTLGGIPGVILGSLTALHLQHYLEKKYFLFFIGVTVLAGVLINLYRLFKNVEARTEKASYLILGSLLIGYEVGVTSAGAGALGSLLLLTFAKLESSKVVGTDLLFGLLISGTGAFIHFLGSNVDVQTTLRLVLSGVPGFVLGAHLCKTLPQKPLRLILLLLLFVVSVNLLWRACL